MDSRRNRVKAGGGSRRIVAIALLSVIQAGVALAAEPELPPAAALRDSTTVGQDLPAASGQAGPQSSAAAPAEKAIGGFAECVSAQSVTAGLGYAQSTGKFTQFKDLEHASAQITDNGALAPLLQYSSKECYFWKTSLQVGRVALGYNLVANYATYSLDRQLTEGPFQGANLGTRLQGDYLVAAPMVFAKLGPLYADREIYWKFGVGVGAALLRYKGTVIAAATDGMRVLEKVDYNADSLSLYTTEVWELQVDRWSLLFKALLINGGGRREDFTLEQYSLFMTYTLPF